MGIDARKIYNSQISSVSGGSTYNYDSYHNILDYNAVMNAARLRNSQQERVLFLMKTVKEVSQNAKAKLEHYYINSYWNKAMEKWSIDNYNIYVSKTRETTLEFQKYPNTLENQLSLWNYVLKLWNEYTIQKDLIYIYKIGDRSEAYWKVKERYSEISSSNNLVTSYLDKWQDDFWEWQESTNWTYPPVLSADVLIQKVNEGATPRKITFPENVNYNHFFDVKPRINYDTIFIERFNNNNRKWDVGKELTEHSFILNGQYTVKNMDTVNWHWFCLDIQKLDIDNISKPIYGEARIMKGISKSGEVGLIIGSNGTNYILYEINLNTNRVKLYYHSESGWSLLDEKSEVVGIVPNKFNKISFYLEKNGIVLFVNNKEVLRKVFSDDSIMSSLGRSYGFYTGKQSTLIVNDFCLVQKNK
jgi:hypothetical protein